MKEKNEKTKKELIVTVGGDPNTGKSRLLGIIKDLLKEKGFEVEFEGDVDHPTEKAFDDYTKRLMENDFNIKIRIKESNMPPPIGKLMYTNIPDFEFTPPPPKGKKIDYKDRTYFDKRRILRQLSIKDEISNFLDIVTDDVYHNLFSIIFDDFSKILERLIGYRMDLSEIDFWHHIRTLLVDGYLSYEIIFNEENKPISLNLIDPLQMITKLDPDTNKLYWVQYPDDPKRKRILTNDQIIYLSYSPNITDFHISYVEQLKESYEKLKMAESALLYDRIGTRTNLKIDIKSVKWLNKCMIKVSKIPSSKLENEIDHKTDDKNYNRFIYRICDTFKKDMFTKLAKLNK